MAASALGSGPPKMLQSERGRHPGWAGKKGPGLGRDTTKWTGPVTHSVPPWLRNHGALNQTPSGQFSCACEGEKDRSGLLPLNKQLAHFLLYSGCQGAQSKALCCCSFLPSDLTFLLHGSFLLFSHPWFWVYSIFICKPKTCGIFYK